MSDRGGPTHQMKRAARLCSVGAQYFAAPFASTTVNSVKSNATVNTFALSKTIIVAAANDNQTINV